MIRSPLFYVGDKYKLMPQLIEYFPKEIELYVEPFFGGGSSELFVESKRYALNDIDKNIIKIHKFLISYSNKKEVFFSKIFEMIDYYGLSCSYKENTIPIEMKKQYPKTYFAQYNRDAYSSLKNDYNKNKNDVMRLYLLLIYGFNHMIRFNKKGDFNLPVGNVDFNKNVYNALNDYFDIQSKRDLIFSEKNYIDFLEGLEMNDKTFIYLDPPYFISQSEYNKLWSEDDEIELYQYLDKLNEAGIKFGITNLLMHKGKINNIFKTWSKKYNCRIVNSNYISFNDNTVKSNSVELYVFN